MKLILPGIPPSKKNSKIIVCRGARPILLPSKNYEEWEEEMLWILKKYKRYPQNEIQEIRITFYPGTHRLFDLSNKAESCLDLLVDAGFLLDDNYSIIPRLLLIFGGLDKKNPRTEIEIVEKGG